jgi:putative SOS response-associated peptidase YedK
MCNLYNLSSKEDIELYFRALVWGSYTARTVGPLGTGLFLRPAGSALEAMEGQWGMIPAGCPTRKPMVPARGTEQKPKPLSTNNARLETIEKARTFAPAWNGNADLHNLLDWAYDLYPERGHEDPAQVARDEFKIARD